MSTRHYLFFISLTVLLQLSLGCSRQGTDVTTGETDSASVNQGPAQSTGENATDSAAIPESGAELAPRPESPVELCKAMLLAAEKNDLATVKSWYHPQLVARYDQSDMKAEGHIKKRFGGISDTANGEIVSVREVTTPEGDQEAHIHWRGTKNGALYNARLRFVYDQGTWHYYGVGLRASQQY